MIERSLLPCIVIDGRNAARSKNGRPNWNHTLVIAAHFTERQFPVFVVMPHWAGKEQQENIHTVSLYVGAARQEDYYDFIINLAPKRVIFNPGTENPQFAQKLNKAGIFWENACTLVLLSTNQYQS